jgi:hypothetical protein
MKKWLIAGLCAMSVHAFAERSVTVQHLQNAKSYFSVKIDDGGLLKGTYPGWCADWDKTIDDNVPYSYKYYSSYSENIPAGLIDHPENLDEVNWIANKDFVGKNAGGELGVYTSGDVQLAIWALLDTHYDGSTVGPYSQARVDRIISLAGEHNGFQPTCRQDIVIVIDPGTPQSTLIEIKRSHFYKCSVPEDDEI